MGELYVLPEGWMLKTLSSVSKSINSGFACSKKYEVDDGYIHLRTHNISSNGSLNLDKVVYIPNDKVDSKKSIIQKDDILFNNTNSVELVGKTALVKEDAEYAYSNHITRIVVDKSEVSAAFVVYYMQLLHSQGYFERICKRWIGQAGVNNTLLKSLDIPLPPLQEQKRIVAKLDSLFERIDRTIALHQQNIDEAGALMGAVLDEVFGELEEKSAQLTMEDVFFIERGGSPRPIKEYLTDLDDGINWIKIGDATKGDGKYIEHTEQKIKPEGLKKSRLVYEGDFIMSNSMSFGKPYIMKTKGAIHDGWLLMREKTNEVDKEFFYYLLSSDYMYCQFLNKASGTTVKNLNINLVKSSKIILPPLEVQQKTVQYLDRIARETEKLKQVQQQKLRQLKELKASILDRAFRGEL